MKGISAKVKTPIEVGIELLHQDVNNIAKYDGEHWYGGINSNGWYVMGGWSSAELTFPKTGKYIIQVQALGTSEWGSEQYCIRPKSNANIPTIKDVKNCKKNGQTEIDITELQCYLAIKCGYFKIKLEFFEE